MPRKPKYRKPYPPEFRREAVALYARTDRTLGEIAADLGVSRESLRLWVQQAQIERGERDGLTGDEREELRELRRRVLLLEQEREILKKAGGLLREGERGAVSLYRFIAAEKANHSISLMCRLLGVSRSGFHAWQRRPPSDRALADAWLSDRIAAMHRESRGTYGVRRVHAALQQQGIRVGRKRVERLMRARRLTGMVPRKRARTTIRVPGVRAATDLVGRDFTPSAPNQLWVADIKYIPTAAGWLYLAAVVDCFSRRVVGWSMRDDLRAELVVDALEMAVARRQPRPGLIHHSDQGTQYVSLLFGERCREAGVEISIGCTSAHDNAVAESFFASLTKDLLRRQPLRSRAEARTAVFDYIETFYNRIRLHSTLDYLSPVDYEKMTEEQRAA
ncbi:MAG: IS3 family transposase [Gaiellaceae bacterium]